jgi:hypothetical protein
VHVVKFFARNLGGLIHARTRVPGRLGKATSRTPSMYVDEKSDEAIVLAKRLKVTFCRLQLLHSVRSPIILNPSPPVEGQLTACRMGTYRSRTSEPEQQTTASESPR